MKRILSIIICVTLVMTLFVGSLGSADAASKAKKYKKILISSNWPCVECVDHGEVIDPQSQYGSIIAQFGCSIKFKKNNTFSCTLGFVGCSGKYKISKKGTIKLILTKKWDGTGAKKVKATKKLKIYGNLKSFSFSLNGVKNRFSKTKKA